MKHTRTNTIGAGEADGEQHFMLTDFSNGGMSNEASELNLMKRQLRDRIKMRYAASNPDIGFILRQPYTCRKLGIKGFTEMLDKLHVKLCEAKKTNKPLIIRDADMYTHLKSDPSWNRFDILE